MTSSDNDPQARLRKSVYLLLAMLAAGAMLGRILAVDDVPGSGIQEHEIARRLGEMRRKLSDKGLDESIPKVRQQLEQEEIRLRDRIRLGRPFLSANDRSRWCTIRALVEPEMRVAEAPYAIDKVIQQPTWDTIDMVKHDGHLYSSKPPLFPTLAAAPYWLVRRATGYTLGTHPYVVGRLLLVVLNVLPMLVYFHVLARLVERLGTSDFGRVFVMAAAAFGTFLTTFSVVVNNHLPAAVSAAIALYAAVRIGFDGRRQLRYFLIAGLFGAFAAANELPALALLAGLGVGLLWKSPLRTILGFVPAAAIVVAGFFGTNWIAHQDLRPPYMHRSETDPADNWYQYTYERNGRQYTSYWQNRVGIDRGEPSRATYALHVLIGHHGIFSLTPVWLLAVIGLGLALFRPDPREFRQLALLIGAVSLVCLLFYLTRPQDDRNYGGMTSGFRWMFWFAPLWLCAMLPAVDRMSRWKCLRGFAILLLVASVASAAYPLWNPWTHPWLLNALYHLGWITI